MSLVNALRRRPLNGSPRRGAAGLLAAVGLVAFLTARPGMPAPPLVPPGPVTDTQKKFFENVTLGELVTRTGVPLEYLRQRLNFGSDVTAETPLAFAMSQYGFTADDVQLALVDYRRTHER
jgi:hypothetical protein